MWITAALQAYWNTGRIMFWTFSLQIPMKQGISRLRPHRAGLRAAPRSPRHYTFPETSVVGRYERRSSAGLGSPLNSRRSQTRLCCETVWPKNRARLTGPKNRLLLVCPSVPCRYTARRLQCRSSAHQRGTLSNRTTVILGTPKKA
jgi:hypothetical protein